jgi:hypothetical protein
MDDGFSNNIASGTEDFYVDPNQFTKRDIYGDPIRDAFADALDNAYIHQHAVAKPDQNPYVYSHSHLYADAHEHPAADAVRAADSNADAV